MTDPAVVTGNVRGGVAVFIEAENGDLVDILYLCSTDAVNDPRADGAKYWPAFDWSPDYDSCCDTCGAVVNKAS